MALSDLLWACPVCGEDRALTEKSGVCRACRTRFERAEDALIRAVSPDGSATARSAAEWVERLPDPVTLLENDPVRTARVTMRTVTSEARVFGDTGYLNRVEVFGKEAIARLRLEPNRLIVEREGDEADVWPLESLTAVQASSNTLQLKRHARPLAAFRFHDDAIFLWENLLRAALRDFYGRTGRGEIREFQPRIEGVSQL